MEIQKESPQSKLQHDFKATRTWFDVTPNITRIDFDFNQVVSNWPLIRYEKINSKLKTIISLGNIMPLPAAAIALAASIECDGSDADKDAVGQIITKGFNQFLEKKHFNEIYKMDLQS